MPYQYSQNTTFTNSRNQIILPAIVLDPENQECKLPPITSIYSGFQQPMPSFSSILVNAQGQESRKRDIESDKGLDSVTTSQHTGANLPKRPKMVRKQSVPKETGGNIEQEKFSIEYIDKHGEVKKAEGVREVLDFIFNYYTKSPSNSQYDVKKINKISGDFRSSIMDKKGYYKLSSEFIEYSNPANPRFYTKARDSSEYSPNSSVSALFYFTLMTLIESENNKDFSLKDYLRSNNFNINFWLKLSRMSPLESENSVLFNSLAYFSIIKKILDPNHRETMDLDPRGINVVKCFTAKEDSFDVIKDELLTGLYCCLSHDHPVLKRLGDCLIDSKKKLDDHAGLKDLFKIAQLSSDKKIIFEEIPLHENTLTKLRNRLPISTKDFEAEYLSRVGYGAVRSGEDMAEALSRFTSVRSCDKLEMTRGGVAKF